MHSPVPASSQGIPHQIGPWEPLRARPISLSKSLREVVPSSLLAAPDDGLLSHEKWTALNLWKEMNPINFHGTELRRICGICKKTCGSRSPVEISAES